MNCKPIAERALSRRLALLLSISLFLLTSLYVFVFAPLYIFFANDVLYMSTVLPEVFSLLSAATDVLVFGIFFGVFLYSVYRLSLKGSIPLIVIYGVAFLYKNVGNLLMTFATDGIPKDFVGDILTTAFYLLLEALQCAVVVTVASVTVLNAKKRDEIRRNASAEIGKPYEPASYLPFRKLVDRTNPLQRAALRMALVPMLVKVASRLLYDIWFTVMYGFYDGLVDVLWMVLYYSLDVVGYGVIVYFTVILLVSHLGESEAKRAARAEVPNGSAE